MTHSIELIASRSGGSGYDKSTEFNMVYLVRGATLVTDAVQEIWGAAPELLLDPVKGGWLVRDQLSWTPQGRRPDGSIDYQVELTYVDASRHDERRQLEVGEYQISFDTTGGSAKFTTSKKTLATFRQPGDTDPYDFQQAINVDSDGNVNGIDVVVPMQKITIRYRQPRSVITESYIQILEEMTGSVNSDQFYEHFPGNLLFLGASGSQGSKADPEISYNFLRSSNVFLGDIGGIKDVAKNGHNVMWVRYVDDVDGSGVIVKKPLFVKIEKVYDELPFAALLIGGSASE